MRITNLPSGALQANTYLAVDEKTNEGFIVDPGGYNKVLTKEVRDNDVNIKYIILTHGHSDHICGVNEHKAEFPDAKIVAYKDEEASAGKSEPEPESGIWCAVFHEGRHPGQRWR